MGRARSLGALVPVVALVGAAACVVPSQERQLLRDFFRACQAYDTVAMARLGTASCNPRTEGVVQDFEITERNDEGVTIAAHVRPFDGPVHDELIRVSLTRQDGRLTVSALTRLPASRTSPAASSALPN